MQHILNSSDRNQAFLKFILFFLLTTALILGAVYFNFQIPEKEKNFYKEEVYEQRKEDIEQQQFLSHMNQAKILLDSMNKSGTDIGEVEQQLNKELNALSNTRLNDTMYIQLNDMITVSFRELKTAKKDRMKNDAEIHKLNEELESIEKDFNKYKEQYNDQNPATENIQ